MWNIMGWLKWFSDSQTEPLRILLKNRDWEIEQLLAEIKKLRSMVKWIPEVPSPSDIVPLAGIYHDGQGIATVDLRKLNIGLRLPPQVWIPEIPDTGSMDPVFDAGNNNILIAGQDAGDHLLITRAVQVGDIVVARIPPDYNEPAQYYVIHRVWQMGMDDQGIYYILKGDHNPVDDGIKVRPEELLWLSVGTIY